MQIIRRFKTPTTRTGGLAAAALSTLLALSPASSHADEDSPTTGPAPRVAPAASKTNPGDTLHIDFVLPFEQALAQAKPEKKLLFIKPIYGGVNQQGADDYRCGSW